MKYVLYAACLILWLSSCRQTSPKDTASEFVKRVYLLDYDNAAQLATEDTRKALSPNELQPMNSQTKRDPGMAIQLFALDSLKETISDNNAVIESEGIRVNMIKDGAEWKVSASKELVDEIVNKHEREEAAAIKWQILYAAYERRMEAAKEYAQYQSQKGSLNADGQELLQVIANTSLPKHFTKAEQLEYLGNQKRISELLEKTIVPSYSANADLSVNLVIRINEAGNTIQQSKESYNSTAKDLHSKRFASHIN